MIRFVKNKNIYRAYSKAQDRIDICQTGIMWTLTVYEAETGLIMHVYTAPRRYLCCQEAHRYFEEGAFSQYAREQRKLFADLDSLIAQQNKKL